MFAESVRPVLEARRADLVADDAVIGHHVRLLGTPGHTPHHVAVLLGKVRNGGTGALIEHRNIDRGRVRCMACVDFEGAALIFASVSLEAGDGVRRVLRVAGSGGGGRVLACRRCVAPGGQADH